MEKWCKSQTICSEDIGKETFTCIANLAEGRAFVCPYATLSDRLKAIYSCSDYEEETMKSKGNPSSNASIY